ncbi:hypothetical protein [Herbiconiux ginsengi]|uniref:EcsC protein family protein n=1 Tax=Herbiconiux ginsengi TaxID=381665 RepID=A0A1H3TRU7_9MICO|nr:hypothetical protein [Herbiconiux ginsengi]SDZ52059.1 hypothetical protein SAMN05216554_4365 [Herbiconiux ginsengi]
MSSRLERNIDRLLSIHRPVVLAHLRSIRRLHPDASPEQLLVILERRYVTAVTSGGAAVGASSMLPFVGTGISLGLSAVETAGFLETTALFAQSVTEVHGIAVDDPDRARALVMTLLMGKAGSDLLKQMAGQATGGVSRNAYWGQVVTSSLPQFVVGPVADQLRNVFVKRFAVGQGANVVGRAIPFGIGAAIGGVGNLMLGRTVIQSARTAFGAPPFTFPMELAITVKAPKAVSDKREKGQKKAGKGERKGISKLVPSRKRTEITEAPGPRDGSVTELPDIRI